MANMGFQISPLSGVTGMGRFELTGASAEIMGKNNMNIVSVLFAHALPAQKCLAETRALEHILHVVFAQSIMYWNASCQAAGASRAVGIDPPFSFVFSVLFILNYHGSLLS